jgi:hypothetical protein
MKKNNQINQLGLVAGWTAVLLLGLMLLPATAENAIQNPGFEELDATTFQYWTGGEVYPYDGSIGSGSYVAKIEPMADSLSQSFAGNPLVSPPREASKLTMDVFFETGAVLEVEINHDNGTAPIFSATDDGPVLIDYDLSGFNVVISESSNITIRNSGSGGSLKVDNVNLNVAVSGPTHTPEPTETPTDKPTPEETPTPTETETETPTPTGSASPTPSQSPTPTQMPNVSQLQVSVNPRIIRMDRNPPDGQTRNYFSTVTISALSSGGSVLAGLEYDDVSVTVDTEGGGISEIEELDNYPGVLSAIFSPEPGSMGRFPIKVTITNTSLYSGGTAPTETVEVLVEAIERKAGDHVGPPSKSVLFKKSR